MDRSYIIYIISGLIYIISNILLLYLSNRIIQETNTNPLRKILTNDEISQIFYQTNYSISYSIKHEYKNLRFLMDYDQCNEYKEKILDLKTKEDKYISKVFSVDLGFIGAIIGIIYYGLILLVFFAIYFYLVYLLGSCLCEHIRVLMLCCWPCFAIVFNIFAIAYMVLIFVLIYYIFWSGSKEFEEFLDCPFVNRDFMSNKYSEMIDFRKDLKYFSFIIIVNIVSCYAYVFSSEKNKSTSY